MISKKDRDNLYVWARQTKFLTKEEIYLYQLFYETKIIFKNNNKNLILTTIKYPEKTYDNNNLIKLNLKDKIKKKLININNLHKKKFQI